MRGECDVCHDESDYLGKFERKGLIVVEVEFLVIVTNKCLIGTESVQICMDFQFRVTREFVAEEMNGFQSEN